MVTVILTVWKRNSLEEQILALMNQTIPPTEIWVYQCMHYINIKKLLKKYPTVKYQYNSGNLSYFGRFSLGLHCNTPFLYIVDDDVISTNNWIENCIRICSENNAIVASSGRIIPYGDYCPEVVKGRKHYFDNFIGDSDNLYGKNYCQNDTLVDFGCNSWFIKTEWLSHFWSITPYTFNSGEDIHLSASCSILAGIKTICPYQDGKFISGNIVKFYGWDDVASHKKPDFFTIRENIIKYLIKERKWTPLNW